MKKLLFWVSTSLIFAFWPISFFLANTKTWPIFILAPATLCLDWFLYLKKFKYHYFLYLILPLFHPVYLFFPLIALLLNLKDIKKPFFLVSYSIILLIVSIFSYKTFYAYSIFTPDPLSKDTLIKKISLIPNRNLARVYENKTTIYQDKYKANLFVFLDPNNYFFSLHPREMGDNQNLTKYPFLAIIPFLIGLYSIIKNPHKKWILGALLTTILTISFVNNPDRYDLFVYLPISLLCFYGLKKLAGDSKIWYWIFTFFFIPISIFELARIIILK